MPAVPVRVSCRRRSKPAWSVRSGLWGGPTRRSVRAHKRSTPCPNAMQTIADPAGGPSGRRDADVDILPVNDVWATGGVIVATVCAAIVRSAPIPPTATALPSIISYLAPPRIVRQPADKSPLPVSAQGSATSAAPPSQKKDVEQGSSHRGGACPVDCTGRGNAYPVGRHRVVE